MSQYACIIIPGAPVDNRWHTDIDPSHNPRWPRHQAFYQRKLCTRAVPGVKTASARAFTSVHRSSSAWRLPHCDAEDARLVGFLMLAPPKSALKSVLTRGSSSMPASPLPSGKSAKLNWSFPGVSSSSSSCAYRLNNEQVSEINVVLALFVTDHLEIFLIPGRRD